MIKGAIAIFIVPKVNVSLEILPGPYNRIQMDSVNPLQMTPRRIETTSLLYDVRITMTARLISSIFFRNVVMDTGHNYEKRKI